MNPNDVPRIAAPLLIAATIVVSFQLEPATPPVELEGGAPPAPSATEIAGVYHQALAAGAPGYDRGAARASVTVLEFADFGCRYCAQFALAAYPALADEFVRSGRVRWKTVPFVLGMFTNGTEAARAGECAAEQGRGGFERMHDRLFARQAEWSAGGDPDVLFRSYAGAAALDTARFAACYAGAAAAGRVRAANDLADKLGVRATPTFFVNGERVEGALPAEQFRMVLENALRKERGS